LSASRSRWGETPQAPRPSRSEQRAFLNRYYGVSRHFYDLTRKYYLFGRDTALDRLLGQPWVKLVEAGVGTGRNLRKLRAQRPSASFGGIDASDEMLVTARERCPFARLSLGFAEDAPFCEVLGAPPDRILFSYCLSAAALLNARRSLAPGGEVLVVDFADLDGLPRPLREGLLAWLRAFHVEPLDLRLFERDATVWFGPLRYFFIARVPAV
jgi:S-adenosylmethionine-diacylgycerolhomoserine-N-methlytransferase